MTSNGAAGDKCLSASYESSNESKEFVHNISAPCPRNPTVEQNTTYLSELRHSVRKLQDNINTFLTEKMSQDKAKHDQKGAQTKSKDEIEEENYGEEQPEDG